MSTAKKYDVVSVGMALVDSIIKGFDPSPISASGYRASSCTLSVGGEAVNEAVTASKLGLKTAILCALGQDMAGTLVLDTLKNNCVDTSFVLYPKEHSTPVTTMFVNEDGTRKSVTNLSHTYNFCPEKHLDSLLQTEAVILGSLFRAPFDNPVSIKAVLECAHENGVLTVADTKLPNFRFMSLEDIKDSLPLIDYITPNEDEARYFTGKDKPEEMAKVFLSYGIRNVVIKLGSNGCYFSSGKERFYLPAIKVEALDATGAGDNFVSGLVSELLRGEDIHSALEFANACGALCSTAVGACTALENRNQILCLLQKRSPNPSLQPSK